ncbi:MAG: DNA phosphorothioation system sulfurtransferase DndC [Rhodospirillales bacterium]|nr:DNA phosphorothioation system sulfurtransferase DndC [Rhodospirillales bacterium]
MEEASAAKFETIRADLLDEYRAHHAAPWIVGYSGGKDSTLVAHLVFEMLMQLPPSQRRRPVHVVANDTLVESPLVVQHIAESLGEIANAACAFGLPAIATITRPDAAQSFWVNLIGRGYPSPNRSFRWCTDRLKIQPTSRYIESQVDEAGQVILLLGVRRSESTARAASVGRYDNGGRLNRHSDLIGCMVYRPIVELDTDDVWEFLALNQPPWGGSHRKLIDLYRDAGGGECPVVTQKSDVPSCGTSSARFGCWTCTVVEKDRSLEGFVEAGFTEFGPLLDFRDWLASIRNDPERRQARRRDGRITVTNGGKFVPGPFTMQTRSEILDRLHGLEEATGQSLIAQEEIDLIRKIWAQDIAAQVHAKSMKVREIGKGM